MRRLLITLLLVALHNVALAGPVCSSIESSPDFAKTINYLKADRSLPPVYDSFSPSRVTLILLDKSLDPNCALITKDAEILAKIELSEPVAIENKLYTFYSLKFPDPKLSELAIKAGRILPAEFMVYDVGSGLFKEVAEANPQLTWIPLLNQSTISHEAFHLYVQFPARANINDESHLQTRRDEILKACYPAEFFAVERKALLRAFDGDALQAAKDFIQARLVRYERLKHVSLNGRNRTLNCELAESYYEKSEGVADYAGIITLLEQNLMTTADLSAYFPEDDDAPYYRTGLLQLLILRRLLSPEDFQIQLRSVVTNHVEIKSLFQLFQAAASK